jgi:hypothetical protein
MAALRAWGVLSLMVKDADGKECVLMKFCASLLVVVALTLCHPTLARANEKHSSLPFSALSARTVYVDNQTTSAELQNTAYMELAKWGRFQIVDSLRKADLVIRLSSGNSVRFVASVQNSSAAPALLQAKQSWTGAEQTVPDGSTRVSLLDPKSGDSLWSGVCKTNNPKAASHLLDGLRSAFDQKK